MSHRCTASGRHSDVLFHAVTGLSAFSSDDNLHGQKVRDRRFQRRLLPPGSSHRPNTRFRGSGLARLACIITVSDFRLNPLESALCHPSEHVKSVRGSVLVVDYSCMWGQHRISVSLNKTQIKAVAPAFSGSWGSLKRVPSSFDIAPTGALNACGLLHLPFFLLA